MSLQGVVVSPGTLSFVENESQFDRQCIRIDNNGHLPIAFRIRVSVQHVFVVPTNEGFIQPMSSTNVEVMMRPLSQHPEIDISKAKVISNIK